MDMSTRQLINFFILCVALLAFASVLTLLNPVPTPSPVQEKIILDYVPQFVLISFDGSRSVDLWRDLRSFKEEMNKEKRLLNFTHFVNAAFFLTHDTKKAYKAPGKEEGRSNVGFSEDLEHLRHRIEEVNLAVADGDEIAPHTVGHFSGRYWSKDEWNTELDSFDKILFGLAELYPSANLPKLNLSRSDIVGFRAPYLDTSPGLYESLHEKRFLYDTSEIASGKDWPKRDEAGMWRIPLGTMNLGSAKSRVLAMDYNVYMHDSHAEDRIKKGTPEWERVYSDTLTAFLDYFNQNYTGNRAPVLIGYHFGSWNDGVYWTVMKDFARQVCGQPQVRCGTFKELVKYMEEYGVPQG